MDSFALLFIFGTIQTTFCTTRSNLDHQNPVRFFDDHSSSKTLKGPFLTSVALIKPGVNKAEKKAERRNEWGREIIEITADPTTEGTLHVPNYPIDCTNEKECESVNSETTPMPTFRPYSQEELNAYLKQYVESNGKLPNGEHATNKLANLYMDEPINVLEPAKDEGKSQEKSKSWQLMQSQAHNHPYDDRTGWVTLEPVPWSASQVQKWEPNNRPQIPQWDKIGQTHSSPPPYSSSSSSSSGNWPKPNNKWQERPWNNKPTYEYPSSSKPQQWNNNNYNKPQGWTNDNWSSGSDIITDNGPTHFPHEPAKKPTWYERPHTEVVYHEEKESYHPHTHPSEGDGRWVLLSSTKGYSVPHRSRAYQRALLIDSKTPSRQGIPSVKSHRSIKLTVLPPLNGTNTTVSHGGLLEVEQTFQTVDEAQREHAAKMLRLKALNQTSTSPSPVASKRSGAAIRVYPLRVTPSQARSNAVLAAVGAGMVPATMAMLLPLVLGKRRRRSVKGFDIFSSDKTFHIE